MDKLVGIDAIGVYVPRLFVELADEWATVRARENGTAATDLIGKITKGVGVRRMAIPDAHEDSATLAAMAAVAAIRNAGIDPRDIDYLAVGTETTVDQSKSMAAYVLGMLEQFYGLQLPDMACPQVQFACIGATYALDAAVNRIRAGVNHKPYALVIATDISRYPLRTPGEYTQGAGAVAMLVAANPRLVALDAGSMHTVTRNERDFFRPNWSQTAVVDGKYSIGVYLDCVEAAWHAWLGWDKQGGALHGLNHLLFHVPFPRMAEYAAARVVGTAWQRDAAMQAALANALPDLPLPTNPSERATWERQLAQTPLFRAAFSAMIEPSLTLGREVGNVYSGALYGALASLFTHAIATDTDLAGQRIGFFSYGSGASAAVWSGTVQPHFHDHPWELTKLLAPAANGGRRIPLTLAQYEHLHARHDAHLALPDDLRALLSLGRPLTASDSQRLAAALTADERELHQPGPSIAAPRQEFALQRLGTQRDAQMTDWGYRYYGWVE